MPTLLSPLGLAYLLLTVGVSGGVLLIDFVFVWGLVDGSLLAPAATPVPVDPAAVVSMVVYMNLFLAFWFWLGWAASRRRFDPDRRGVVQDTPTGTRLDLSPAWRALLRWMIVLSAAMAPAFVIGFGSMSRQHPGVGWVFVAWCWVMALIVLVWRQRPMPTASFLHDDPAAGTLTWQLWTPRQLVMRAVCRSAITGVSVREGVRRFGVEVSEVVLHWRIGDGEPQSDVVAGYANPNDADALAGWLNERFGVGG